MPILALQYCIYLNSVCHIQPFLRCKCTDFLKNLQFVQINVLNLYLGRFVPSMNRKRIYSLKILHLSLCIEKASF